MEKPITYTEAITELDTLVQKMQSPQCDIDHLSEYTKRAKELLDVCRRKLTETDTELKRILADLDTGGQQA